MSKKISVGRKYRPIIAGLLAAAAICLGVMAWQSLSTEQYKLYDRHYAYYVSQAAECREKAETNTGYAILAGEWEESVQLAGSYLMQHRVGAGCLAVVALACVALGVKVVLPVRQKEEEVSEKEKKRK